MADYDSFAHFIRRIRTGDAQAAVELLQLVRQLGLEEDSHE